MAEGTSSGLNTPKDTALVSPPIEFVLGQGAQSLHLRCEPQKPPVNILAFNVGKIAMIDSQQHGPDHQDWIDNHGDNCYIIKEGADHKPQAEWGFKTDHQGAIVALSAHLQQDGKTLSLRLNRLATTPPHDAAVLKPGKDNVLLFEKLLPSYPHEYDINGYEAAKLITTNETTAIIKIDGQHFVVKVNARKRAEQEIETHALRNYYAPGSWEITSQVQQVSEPQIV